MVATQLSVEDSPVWLLYARPLSDVDHTIARVQVILLLGVLGGTVLALLGGLATAARAMRPIVQLTDAAREIERTRDPTLRLPHPEADDEVAELTRTVEGMLGSLDAARSDTHAALERQREFVADASHELRTPLTSLLANLELLAEELGDEQADTAQAALRSARRMRRLVGDLLLLARADAERVQSRGPTDLADVLLEAASELGPMAEDHELSIDAQARGRARRARRPPPPDAEPDRERRAPHATRHAHPGGARRSRTASAVLTVEDDGPGIPPELEPRVFDRFVRGAGTGTRGSGLGLAIVRAVAESHGGTVSLEQPEAGTGARFVIRIPRAPTAGDGDARRPPSTNAAALGGAAGRLAAAASGPAERRGDRSLAQRDATPAKIACQQASICQRQLTNRPLVPHLRHARRRHRAPPARSDRQAVAAPSPHRRRGRGRPHARRGISVLLHVARAGRIRLSELSESEGINPTMLSRVIADFVEHGLLERVSDPGDRRAAFVEATPAGRRLAERIRRERTDALNVALDALDEHERTQIEAALPALERLAEQLKDERP